MSFSSDVKRELSSVYPDSKEKKLAECYGYLLFAGKFSSREIVFKTENHYSASCLEQLLSELFAPVIERESKLRSSTKKQGLYKTKLIIPEECRSIFEYYGHSNKDISLRINRANIDDEGLYPDFLRGVFLSCGSVTDPQKGYHLELNVQHKALAENLVHLINEIEVLSVKPRIIARKGIYVVYFKGNTGICDFLGYIGAGNSVMTVIETLAYKEMINKLNRKHNSELANIQKLAAASAKQIHSINKIIECGEFDSLSDELKALATLRLENPEMSLKELGETLEPKISRSGVNHRLERLQKIADKL
jgi:DNA-binding protein WhiA